MKWLLILLFTLPAFAIDDNSFAPELARYDSIEQAKIAEIMKQDVMSLARVAELKEIVRVKAFRQRHPYIWWLKPDSIEFEVSLRKAKITVISDYYLGFTAWKPFDFHIELERQDGLSYINYKAGVGNERARGSNWEYNIETRESQAYDLSRQKIVCRRRFWFLGVGVAGVADSYDFNRSRGVMDFRIPFKWGDKYDYGYVNYQTNYSGLEILDVYLKIEERKAKTVKPFIAGKFYNVTGGQSNWGIVFGFKLISKEVDDEMGR